MTGREEPYLDMSDSSEHSHESADNETRDWDNAEEYEESNTPSSYQPDHLHAEEPEQEHDDVLSGPPPDLTDHSMAEGMMPKKLAFLLLGVAAVTAVIGWLVYMKAVIPCAIGSVIVTTALLCIFRSMHAKRWLLHCILLGATILAYIMTLFGFYPLWHRNFNSYGDELVALVEKTGKKVSTDTKEDSAITNNSVEIVKATTQTVKSYLTLNLTQRFRITIQMALFSATLLILVLVIIGITPGLGTAHVGSPPKGFLAWFGPGTYRLVNGIGMFSLARILKALVICVICGVGLRIAGFTSAPFIAGTVFCVALISYLSPGVALVLGAFTAFTMDKWAMSLIYLLIVCAVLSLAEKKLYWFLRLFPLLRRYLPEPREGSGAIGQTVGWVARMVPHVLSLAMFVGVIFMLYQIYDVYNMNIERAKLVKEADNLLEQNNDYKGAYDMYYDIAYNKYDGHPANLRLCHKMLECKLKAGRYQQAVLSADILAEYDPAKPTEFKNPEKIDDVKESGTSFLNRFRYETAKVMADKAIKKHRADEGYELVIKDVHQLDQPSLLETLGKKTLTLNEDNVWGYVASARAAYLQEQYTDAIAFCRKGLSKKPNEIILLHVQANSHFALGEYDDCINLTRKILEYDPEDTEAIRLKVKAGKAKSNPPAPPEPVDPPVEVNEPADKPIEIELPEEK